MSELVSRIAVHDDVVPEQLRKDIGALLKRPIWAYGWKSIAHTDKYCYWHAHFAGGDYNSRLGADEQLRLNRNAIPIWQLWDHLSKTILVGHEVLRAYGNAHTYGTEGYLHADNKDTENYFSTIVYVSDDWQAGWGGETNFYSLGRHDIIKSVSPLPFRIVSFPGHIPHKANAPTRDCPELRTVVVFKSQIKPRTVTPKGIA